MTNASIIKWRHTFVVGLMLFIVYGCQGQPPAPGAAPAPPPVVFSFRESQIPTRGMVVGIQNTTTDETLEGLVVKVQSPEEEGVRSHRIGDLLPQDTITVGWMELDGWVLKSGDEVTVSCDGYSGEAGTAVPDL